MDTTSSVDDFIKELEAKEKDLLISSDLTIEIEDPDFDTVEMPSFAPQDVLMVSGSAPNPVQAAQTAGLKTRVFELENDLKTLQDRIRELRAERTDIQEKSDRRLKDFENYKYRMDRERRGAFIEQISNLAGQILPVLDNLDRALGSATATHPERSAEFKQVYDGIVLVNQQVNEVIAGMGVQPIATVGEKFDPNFHEAVAVEERSDIASNTILSELLRGYRIGNRVIRHSMVRVTTAPPSARKEPVWLDPEEDPQNQTTLEPNPPDPTASTPEAE
ncbi:hypothetical protein BH10ACI2_BH10ACI2_10160 [soil metagenome]